MSGRIELDRDGRTLLVTFAYDKYLVDEVKALAGRRWDPGRKAWTFPIERAEAVITSLMRHGFYIDTDVTAVLAGTQATPPPAPELNGANAVAEPAPKPMTRGKPAPTPARITTATPSGEWRVAELNERVRAALTQTFPERVKVIGEISNLDKNRERKHLFFSLVEKEPGGGKILANVDVALFERTAQRLIPSLERAGLTLRDGIEILVEAKVDLYPQTGRYQLVIEYIKPEFTLGQMALSREQILRELRAAGLERRNAELVLPIPAMRIGVLTSPDSDGWNDFLQEIKASKIGFSVELFPVRVQGEELEPTMLRGLKWFARHAERFDVLCIVRGGGSRTDLAWFDDKAVAFAVAQHPLKVLVGIGHERDRSVLDEIAHPLKTPTAVAAFLVERWHATFDELHDVTRQLADAARKVIAVEHQALASRGHALLRGVHVRFATARHGLAATAARIARSTQTLLRDHDRRIARSTEQLVVRGTNRFERARAWLDASATRQRLLDPKRVLQRGYAMLRDVKRGRVLTDVGKLSPGLEVDLLLRDGEARARVESVRPNPQPD
ncbi:MAG: exodeoxyribonuclease VII large subunit [Planctomycetes bacterium]|nr:exodeoxyribonuclease VII large subunit [Planctomycetota bacterium]